MLDFNLIKNILIVAIGSSIITTAVVQKIKESLNSKKYLWLISLGISMVIGTLFAICFSDLSIVNSLWCGLICWIGADAIYKTFEEKVFKPFAKMQEVVEVPKEQIITLEEIKEGAENEIQ